MPVGIVDVGSNTMRLLVARTRKGSLDRIAMERVQLCLGADVESDGRISPEKLERAREAAATLAAQARSLGAARIDVLVTSPGRQADNGVELRRVLELASGAPARILTAEEEGELAYAGAVDAVHPEAESVAVVDVGGGSAQLVVGTPFGGPVWTRSVDLGSLRLTRRSLESDPPSALQLADAGGEVERAFKTVTPPLPLAAIATGGSARALRRITGRRRLDRKHLEAALDELVKRPSRDIAKKHGLRAERARTLIAGTLILAEAQRRLGLPLEVARGGIREGAALALLAERAAA